MRGAVLFLLMSLAGCQATSGTSFADLPPGAVYRPGPAGADPNADPYTAWMRGR